MSSEQIDRLEEKIAQLQREISECYAKIADLAKQQRGLSMGSGEREKLDIERFALQDLCPLLIRQSDALRAQSDALKAKLRAQAK